MPETCSTLLCYCEFAVEVKALCDKLGRMLNTAFVMKYTAAGELHHMINSNNDNEVLFCSCWSESLHEASMALTMLNTEFSTIHS